MLVLVLLVGGVCGVVESRRSRRCTESVVASCVSVADQNIGINKAKPSDQFTPRHNGLFHLTPCEQTIISII